METLVEPVRSLPRRGHPVILCVDDEPQVLAALRRCLRKEFYRVITASCTEEALGWFLDFPEVDLVLSDERMPAQPGTELLREVRRKYPRTIRALLTGYPSRSLLERGLEAGVETFIYKPWDDAVLRGTIRRLLGLDPGAPPPALDPEVGA